MRTAIVFALLFLVIILPALYPDQQDSQSKAVQLRKEADTLFNNGDCESAILKFDELIKMYEESKDRPGIGNVLYRLGVCFNNTGKYEKSFEYLKQAEAIHTETEDTNALAFDILEMAKTQALRSNYKDSESLAQKALQIHEKNGNQEGIADSLRLIADAVQILGDSEKSLGFAERSLAISTGIGDKAGAARSLAAIAQVYWNRADYPQALGYFEKSLQIAEEAADKKTALNVMKSMANIYGDQGDHSRERETYDRALKIANEINDLPGKALILMSTGALEYGLGHFGKANQLLLESLTISEAIGNKRYIAGCLSNLAGVQFYSGNDSMALDYLQKSARIMEEIGDQRTLSIVVANFGAYYYEHADYSKALEYFQKSLRIRKEIEDKEGIIWSLYYLGEAYEKLGKYDQAQDSYQEALALSKSTGAKDLGGVIYLGIGTVQFHKKEFASAEISIDLAIEIASRTNDWTVLWPALRLKAKILNETGRETDALASIQKAVDIIESVRASIDLAEQKAGYFESKRGAYEDLIELLFKAKNIEAAFHYAQRSKARAFLDMLVEANVDPSKNLDSELIGRKKQILKNLADIQNEIREESEGDTPTHSRINGLTAKRTELEEEYSNLQVEIRRQNPRYADIEYPQPVSLHEAQQMLDDHTILLEYFIGESHSFLFTITRDVVRSYVLPGDKQLTEQVLQMRESLQNSKDSGFKKISPVLYSELVKPAEDQLEGKKRILIAPDGPLNYLPFESLIGSRNNESSQIFFLALQFEIQYVPSISVLKAIHQKPAPKGQKQLIAFANPLLMESAAKENQAVVRDWVGVLGALPNAKTEVEEIAKLYTSEDVSIMLGRNASESNVKKMKLNQYRKVHFASHGLIDEEKPEFSALVLSPDEKGEEDGFLTMREVFDLQLNADLVVLSACKTGLGDNIRGEGVSGLSRAFLVAGASTVLVSLWDVYDKTTADFMKAFYWNMERKKMTKTEALKQVRINMIQNRKTSHPYYWAPFILIGEN